MRFSEVLKEITWRLITEERISYRSIRSDFDLDDDGLEELRSFLVQNKGLAIDLDGKFLILASTAAPNTVPEPDARAALGVTRRTPESLKTGASKQLLTAVPPGA